MNFKKYIPLLLISFVNVVGFTILIPVFPQVTTNLTNEQLAPIVFGVLISSFALCQFLGAPLLGSLSDKYGRRPLLFISQLGTTIGWVIFALSYFIDSDIRIQGVSLQLIVIVLSRIIDGLTGGNISVASAWISDMTPKAEKAKTFGLMGAVFGTGLLIGPSIGGFTFNLFNLGYLPTAIVAILISLFTLFQVWFFLPESLPEEKRDKTLDIRLRNEFNIFKQFKRFSDHKLIKNVLTLRLFFALIFSSYTTLVSLLLATNFGLDSKNIGIIVSIIGVFSILNQGFLVRKVVRKYGDVNTMFAGVAVILIGLFFAGFLKPEIINFGPIINILIFIIDSYLINLGISFAMPSFKSVLTNNVEETKQGKITGLDESILALGNGISPIFAGVLFTLINSYAFLLYFLLLFIPFIILRGKIEHARHQESKILEEVQATQP